MKRFAILIMISALIISCSEIAQQEITIEKKTEYTIKQKNDLISSYAQILAASINDMDLKKVIKKEAQIQFDGDYDILTSKFETLNLNEQEFTVRQRIAAQSIMTRSNENGFDGSLEELMDEIKKEFPNLQVSVPVHCDEWDPEKYTPMVAFLPYDFDERTATIIEAFDCEGNSHMLSATEEPEFPVIVVSISERIDAEGNPIFETDFSDNGTYIGDSATTKATLNTPTSFSLKHSTSRSLELYWDAIVSSGHYEVQRRALSENTFRTIAQLDGDENFYKDNGLTVGGKYSYRLRLVDGTDQSPYTQIMTSTAAERTCGERVKLVWTQMPETVLKNVESWGRGRPEIRIIVFYGVTAGGDAVKVRTDMISPTRNHIKDGCKQDLSIIESWDPNEDGASLAFVWMEEDGEGSYEVGSNILYEKKTEDGILTTGTHATYTGTFESQEIGRGYASWWDPYSTDYRQGIIFRLNKESI